MAEKFALIGTGNVAWHLGRVLENAGHLLVHVYDRKLGLAKKFTADYFNASYGDTTDMRSVEATVFIMAISDHAIATLSQQLKLPEGAILCHTSGSTPLSKLGYADTLNRGVFYPLQTFSKGVPVDFTPIPICIEAENQFTLNVLKNLGQSISQEVVEMSGEQRKALHLAAVFACNFTNHMLAISKEILEAKSMSFAWLKPLITETIHKSIQLGPEHAQTGPAIRGDLKTLDQQLKALEGDVDLARIYQYISQHIIDTYSE